MSIQLESSTSRDSMYYVIPGAVFDNERLLDGDKMLYALIAGLANNKGYCWASNNYLAKRLFCSVSTVKRGLSILCNEQLITSTILLREGSLEVETRHIHILPIEFSKGGVTSEPGGGVTSEPESIKVSSIKKDIPAPKERQVARERLQERTTFAIEYWNNRNIIVHKAPYSNKNIASVRRVLKSHGEDKLLEAISIYHSILKGKEYYLSHKWTLWEFCDRQVEKFFKESDPYSSYSKNKQEKKSKTVEELYG